MAKGAVFKTFLNLFIMKDGDIARAIVLDYLRYHCLGGNSH